MYGILSIAYFNDSRYEFKSSLLSANARSYWHPNPFPSAPYQQINIDIYANTFFFLSCINVTFGVSR